MARRPWKRSDNIRRVLSHSRVAALLTAFQGLRPKNAPWIEMDADDAKAWWRDVLNDPRARRTQADRIPKDHVDAQFRLDRWPGAFVTFRCATCGAHAVYESRRNRRGVRADARGRYWPKPAACPSSELVT